jgi:hypothetical protein
MDSIIVLLLGFLVLIMFAVVSAAIMIAAPYIAVIGIVLAICWAVIMIIRDSITPEKD